MSSPKLRLRRALEDYQVDRADVEVQQCMKLTATNSPFGLTIKFTLGMEWPHNLSLPINIQFPTSNEFG
jgi:hypothetical protein